MTRRTDTPRIQAIVARIDALQRQPKSHETARDLAYEQTQLRRELGAYRAQNWVMIPTFLILLTILIGAYPLLFPQNYRFGTGGMPHAIYQLASFAVALLGGGATGRIARRWREKPHAYHLRNNNQ